MEPIADLLWSHLAPIISANISKCLKLFNCFQHYTAWLHGSDPQRKLEKQGLFKVCLKDKDKNNDLKLVLKDKDPDKD